MTEFRTIVADPPWPMKFEANCNPATRKVIRRGKWGDPSQDNSKIKALEYPTMTLDQIAALRFPASDNAHCYIWTVNKYLEQTYDISRAWGFEPSCLLTWVKKPMGLGLGGTFSSNIEFILFCRKGSLPALNKFDTRWWQWPRGKHSQKPEAFFDVVMRVSPPLYLELFARSDRLGWSTWGNECFNHVALA